MSDWFFLPSRVPFYWLAQTQIERLGVSLVSHCGPDFQSDQWLLVQLDYRNSFHMLTKCKNKKRNNRIIIIK